MDGGETPFMTIHLRVWMITDGFSPPSNHILQQESIPVGCVPPAHPPYMLQKPPDSQHLEGVWPWKGVQPYLPHIWMVTKDLSPPFYVLTYAETDADHKRFRIHFLFKKAENGTGILRGYTFRRYRLGVIVLLMFTFFAVYGGEEITTYYIINPPLCFDSIYIGFYRAFDYIIRFAAGILLERYGQTEISRGE